MDNLDHRGHRSARSPQCEEGTQIVLTHPHRRSEFVSFEFARSDPAPYRLLVEAEPLSDLLDREEPDLGKPALSHGLPSLICGRASDPRGDKCLQVLNALTDAAPRHFADKRSSTNHA